MARTAAPAYDLHLQCLRTRLEVLTQWLRSQWQQMAHAHGGLAVADAEVDWLLARATASPVYDLPELQKAETSLFRRRTSDRVALTDTRFGLTPLERAALFVCLAPELDPGLRRVYAYAQDDAARTAPTPALVLSLYPDLARSSTEGLARFLPTAPLRRFRLIQLEPGPAGLPLAQRAMGLDERITGFLLGDDSPDPRVYPVLKPVTDAVLLPSREELVAPVAARLAEGPVNLVAPPGHGQRALALAAARQLGLSGILTAPVNALTGHDIPDLAAREVRLQGAALLLEAEPGDSPPPAVLTETVPCLIASPERLAGWPLELPPVPKEEQIQLWTGALDLDAAARAPLPAIESIVEHFGLDPDAIAATAGTADGTDLWEACRRQGRKSLDGLAHRIVSHATWDDIVLQPDIERHLREIAAAIRHRYAVYEGWGFAGRSARGRGIAALFAGPSGCGKTLAAEVLATDLQLDLYRIDLAGVVSKYIGETEKNLRKIFDAAEQAGAILFFDEADALFGKRSEVKDAHDRYANIEIDYLLQRMEEYRGLAILATNMRQALDPAFVRRLRYLVEFPFPDGEERRRIWARAFPPGAPAENLDFTFLARLELAGGNITSAALSAAFLAAAEQGPIRMEHVIRAVRREFAKLERPLPTGALGPYASLIKP